MLRARMSCPQTNHRKCLISREDYEQNVEEEFPRKTIETLVLLERTQRHLLMETHTDLTRVLSLHRTPTISRTILSELRTNKPISTLIDCPNYLSSDKQPITAVKSTNTYTNLTKVHEFVANIHTLHRYKQLIVQHSHAY